jgi:hypothetical protein
MTLVERNEGGGDELNAPNRGIGSRKAVIRALHPTHDDAFQRETCETRQPKPGAIPCGPHTGRVVLFGPEDTGLEGFDWDVMLRWSSRMPFRDLLIKLDLKR